MWGEKQIDCPKGEWTTLFRNFAAGMPAFRRVTFVSSEGDAVDGEFVEERAFAFFLPRRVRRGRLGASMDFERGWFDGFYSVRVRATTDLVARVE